MATQPADDKQAYTYTTTSSSEDPPSKSPSSTPSHASLPRPAYPVKWYRSTFFNAVVLGLANFAAPGIWGAMNSLGGGGEQSPWLVNSANALTFCLMVLSCAFSGIFVKYLGIKWTLILGAAGYCPYAAGLYSNNRYGAEWFVLLGAALCGLGAGIFWMAEAAIAISYPEPQNQGRFFGLWLSFRVLGQILGGAINTGLNADRDEAGSVGYTVFLVFVAIQATAPVVGLLLTPPAKVQRTDGVRVVCGIPRDQPWSTELKAIGKLFVTKKFLLLVIPIANSVYGEAVFFTYAGLYFSVRARALGSLVSGLISIAWGNLLGLWLDRVSIPLKTRARIGWAGITILAGAWWIYGTVLVTEFNDTRPVYDWSSPGFARAWAWFLLSIGQFQLGYMFTYFIISSLADTPEEVVRYSGLLRGTESAAQAVSYGLNSVDAIGRVGGTYINFGLWALAIYPAWLVVRDIGVVGGEKANKRFEIKEDGERDA